MAAVKQHRITHRETREAYLNEIREKFCEYLHISEEDYYNLHFELAFSWYKKREVFRDESLPFLVSKGYHKWWGNLLALIEEEIMRSYQGVNRRDYYLRSILNMELRPGYHLMEKFRKEGQEILEKNTELQNTTL